MRLRRARKFFGGTDLLENVEEKESLTDTALAVGLGNVFDWVSLILGGTEGDFPLSSIFLPSA